jgi:hypothetical protein
MVDEICPEAGAAMHSLMTWRPRSTASHFAGSLLAIAFVCAAGCHGNKAGPAGQAGQTDGDADAGTTTTLPGPSDDAGTVTTPACVPMSWTCAVAGVNCGFITDGCSGKIDCGACPTGETCGGAGTANHCGIGTCTPSTCAALGATCGVVSDGCGDILSCGTCGAGETCGGGGANRCGPTACTPKTCASESKTCGVISDGCGGSITCGVCGSGTECGAAVANVCTTPCPLGCPSGYTCGSGGVCTGGDPTHLVLNAKTFVVSGKVTVNGSGINCSPLAKLRFTDNLWGNPLDFLIACDGTFSAIVPPGTYELRAIPNDGLNETTGFVVNPALAVTAAHSGLAFDLKTFAVSGKVTLGGAVPKDTAACANFPNNPKVTVELHEPTLHYDYLLQISCNSADYSFSGSVAPGTYQVTVYDASLGPWTNLPPFAVVEASPLSVTAAVSGLAYDVPLPVAVSGKVTLNGATPPVDACQAGLTSTTVTFFDKTTGQRTNLGIPCGSSGYAFAGPLLPGTYQVTVNGEGALPEDWRVDAGVHGVVINPALMVTAPVSNLVLDVKSFKVAGHVTVNGAALKLGTSCTTGATLLFTEKTAGYAFEYFFPCSATDGAFSLPVIPGTYKVRVGGNDSNLPPAGYVVNPALTVGASMTGLAFDVQTYPVAGKITVNGAAPSHIAMCPTNAGPVTTAFAILEEPTLHYNFRLEVQCAATDYAFSFTVLPGTYRAMVGGLPDLTGNDYSNIPLVTGAEGYVANPALAVSGAVSSVTLDAQSVSVSASVLWNGAVPKDALIDPATPASGTQCAAAGYADIVKTTVYFREKSGAYELPFVIPCKSTKYSFTLPAFPATYEVFVDGASRYPAVTNLPTQRMLVVPRLAIP